MPANHRKSNRIEFDQTVEVYPVSSAPSHGPKPNETAVWKVKNISKEGICLETRGFLMPNQVYKIDFHLFSKHRIQTFAKVVWSEKNSGGLAFLKPQDLVDFHLNFIKTSNAKVSSSSNETSGSL